MIHHKLNELLEKHNWSAYYLSKMTGIDQRLLSRYRKGTSTPRRENLEKISEAFGLEVFELFK